MIALSVTALIVDLYKQPPTQRNNQSDFAECAQREKIEKGGASISYNYANRRNVGHRLVFLLLVSSTITNDTIAANRHTEYDSGKRKGIVPMGSEDLRSHSRASPWEHFLRSMQKYSQEIRATGTVGEGRRTRAIRQLHEKQTPFKNSPPLIQTRVHLPSKEERSRKEKNRSSKRVSQPA